MGFESNTAKKTESAPSIKDVEEALTFILEQYENGERPKVSVKTKYCEPLKQGLREHSTWDPGEGQLLVGTFGRDPYMAEDPDRVLVEIKDIDPEQIKPRLTGPDNAFHGVVTIEGPVPPEKLEML